ncbi:MAG: efflux RND transporter periplasmic adaptor subunit [Deltaproteobacteria bacterium]
MRYLVVIIGLVLGLGVLVGVKGAQIAQLIHFGQAMAKTGPPPESVNTARAVTQNWGGTLNAVGSVVSEQGVSLSNEVPGVVSKLNFESGARVKQGQLLLELDSSVEKAQLASTRAKLKLAQQSLQRSQRLAPSGAIPAAQLDTDESSVNGLAADEQALRAQIERKSVRAPFSGRLGIRAVNLGQYLAPGTMLTVLESTEAVFVDFAIPQTESSHVHRGMPVRAQVDAAGPEPMEGTVSAIDPSLDPQTRNIRVRASLKNQEDRLRPGMFVRVAVVLPEEKPAVVVPATSVVHASYGDSIFVVEPKKTEAGEPSPPGPDGKPVLAARQQFVQLGPSRGDFVAILKGLKEGEEVVSAGAFKLRNGMSVAVKNEVDSAPQLAPHPENR